jgi:hypothetical protein
MDVNGYLRRFIDIEFILPKAKSEVFVSHLFAQLGLHERFEKRRLATKGHIDDRTAFEETFSKLCVCFQLSLRDIEQCCAMFALAYFNTDDTHFVYPYLLSILVVLKLVNKKLYHQYVSGQCTGEEVVQFILKQPGGRDFLSENYGMLVDAHLLAASPDYWRNPVFEQMTLRFKKQPLTRPEFMPDRLKTMHTNNFERLLEICSYLFERQFGRSEISNHTLGYLSKKIELASLMLDYRE